MATTHQYIKARLPICLADITIDYFGRSAESEIMAQLGQYEDCEKVPYALGYMLIGACKGGHIAIAELAIAKGAKNVNDGMRIASLCGEMPIVKLAIAHGADNWDTCLVHACYGSHLEIAKLMLAKGATSTLHGMLQACAKGNLAIVELMMANGSVNIDRGIKIACENGHVDIVRLLMTKRNEIGQRERLRPIDEGIYLVAQALLSDSMQKIIS